MSEHPFQDELPLFALGALASPDRQRVDEHLASGCAVCRGELASLEQTVALLPLSLAAEPPPADLKERLMARLAEEMARERRAATPESKAGDAVSLAPSARATPGALRTEPAVSNVVPFRPMRLLALAASLLLAALLGGLWMAARREVDVLAHENAELQKSLRTQRQQHGTQLASQAREVAWLHDPRVQIALLKGLESTSLARAKLLFNPESKKGLLYVEGLPPLPLEKSYELWVFVKDTPLPADVFDAASGSAVFPISKLDGAAPGTKFAVTIEPRGGLPKPSGAIVLVGNTL